MTLTGTEAVIYKLRQENGDQDKRKGRDRNRDR